MSKWPNLFGVILFVITGGTSASLAASSVTMNIPITLKTLKPLVLSSSRNWKRSQYNESTGKEVKSLSLENTEVLMSYVVTDDCQKLIYAALDAKARTYRLFQYELPIKSETAKLMSALPDAEKLSIYEIWIQEGSKKLRTSALKTSADGYSKVIFETDDLVSWKRLKEKTVNVNCESESDCTNETHLPKDLYSPVQTETGISSWQRGSFITPKHYIQKANLRVKAGNNGTMKFVLEDKKQWLEAGVKIDQDPEAYEGSEDETLYTFSGPLIWHDANSKQKKILLPDNYTGEIDFNYYEGRLLIEASKLEKTFIVDFDKGLILKELAGKGYFWGCPLIK